MRLRPQSLNCNINNSLKHELTVKKLSVILDNNRSKLRNSRYTLSNPLIVHSLKIPSPHRPGGDDLPFQLITSPEQNLLCSSLASCRVCLLFSLLLSNRSQHLHKFLRSLLHLWRGHLSKCCSKVLCFNFEFLWL